MRFIDQGQIINNINEEFTRSRMPMDVRFDKSGVCRGLSTVYAKFCLQGREDDFKEMLELIVSKKISNEKISESDVYVFAAEVLMAQQPDVYDQQFTQNNSMQLLSVDGKPLSSAFNFALSTDDANWVDIFKKLNFEQDEVVLLASNRHCVAVRKESDQYKVYDPNYQEGFKNFKTEKELIEELHFKVFHCSDGNFGIGLNVLRHPERERSKELPKDKDLYKQYYDPKNSKITTFEFNSNSSLTPLFPMILRFDKLAGTRFSAQFVKKRENDFFENVIRCVRDKESIQLLLDKENRTAEQLFVLAGHALNANNVVALKTILPKIEHNNEEMKRLIYSALYLGLLESFEVLEPYLKTAYENDYTSSLINKSAIGGNPKLLQKILDIPSKDTSNPTKLSVGIECAIRSGSYECVKLMIEKLDTCDASDKVNKLSIFFEAIQQNKAAVLIGLINDYPQISKDMIQQTSITSLMASRMNLDVLEVLRDNGVKFSKKALDVMQQKKEGGRLDLKTKLDLFISHLSEFLGGIKIHIARQFKTQLRHMREPKSPDLSPTSNTNDSEPKKMDIPPR